MVIQLYEYHKATELYTLKEILRKKNGMWYIWNRGKKEFNIRQKHISALDIEYWAFFTFCYYWNEIFIWKQLFGLSPIFHMQMQQKLL